MIKFISRAVATVTTLFALIAIFAPENPSSSKLFFFRYVLSQIQFEVLACCLVTMLLLLIQWRFASFRAAAIHLRNWFAGPLKHMSLIERLIYASLFLVPTLTIVLCLRSTLWTDTKDIIRARAHFYETYLMQGLRGAMITKAYAHEDVGEFASAAAEYKRYKEFFPEDDTSRLDTRLAVDAGLTSYAKENYQLYVDVQNQGGDSRDALFHIIEALRANPSSVDLSRDAKIYLGKLNFPVDPAAQLKRACSILRLDDAANIYGKYGWYLFEPGVNVRLAGRPKDVCAAIEQYTPESFSASVQNSWQLDKAKAIVKWSDDLSLGTDPDSGTRVLLITGNYNSWDDESYSDEEEPQGASFVDSIRRAYHQWRDILFH